MVEGVRLNGAVPTERVAPTSAAPAPTRAVAVQNAAPSTIAVLAAQAAPVDISRVAAIRAGIADGSYTVDADAIAARMIETDLPPR
ncbi:hypothetical protein BH09PSE3_BH09PSE3_13970 [soil metagenome]